MPKRKASRTYGKRKRGRYSKKKSATKTKSNYRLTKAVKTLQKNVKLLKDTNEAVLIQQMDLPLVALNAESYPKLYHITREESFRHTSTGFLADVDREARKGQQLVMGSLRMYFTLFNRQSCYNTRLIVLQFKEHELGNRGQLSAPDQNPGYAISEVMEELCKWGFYGNHYDNSDATQPDGANAAKASLFMCQPYKLVKDRTMEFRVLHDEVFRNKEPDQDTSIGIENQHTTFKRIVKIKHNKLTFKEPTDYSPHMGDIIAIVFNDMPKTGVWTNPSNPNANYSRRHCLRWEYNTYDN